MGLRLGAGKYLGLVNINDMYVLILFKLFILWLYIPYVMRPISTRTSPPHLSPSSVSDPSPLEAMTCAPWAVIVEVW